MTAAQRSHLLKINGIVRNTARVDVPDHDIETYVEDLSIEELSFGHQTFMILVVKGDL